MEPGSTAKSKGGGGSINHALVTIRANTRGSLVPLLITGTPDGDAEPLLELLELSVTLLAGNSSFDDVHALNKVMGRYADLYVSVYGSTPITAENLFELTLRYADYRLNGSCEIDGTDETGLGWKIVKWSTFSYGDLRHLTTYSKWCTSRYGYIPLIPSVKIRANPDALSISSLLNLAQMKQRDFMAHLAASRGRWRKMDPDQGPMLMPIRKRSIRRGADQETLTEDFVSDLIEAERNPVYRAIWILAAWGGPRLSEQLQMWVIDVLPGTARERFFKGYNDLETPLVVIADPWESTWTGHINDNKTSRKQYLWDRFKLVPRVDLGPAHSSEQADMIGKVGFKGVAYTNEDRLLSQIYWTNRTMAHEYFDLAKKMIQFRAAHHIGDRHPWLWVVTDPRKEGDIGKPIKLSSVESAWERACRRLGVKPYGNGRSPHGLRHFYKSYAENVMGMSPDIIQTMMHHRSINSQKKYGWVANERMHAALNEAFDKILPPSLKALPKS